MSPGLTAQQTAQIAGGLRWTTERLFAVLGGWAAQAERTDVAVALATASRHLGWHAGDLVELMPDSVLLDTDPDTVGPSDTLVAALDRIEGTESTEARLAVASRVLLTRLSARAVAIERLAAPHSDAPLERAIERMLTDLRTDRDDLESRLDGIVTSAEQVDAMGAAVVAAERELLSAGGLVPLRIDL